MNKKLIATLVMSSVIASAFAVNAGAASDKQVLKDEKGAVHNVVGTLGKVSGATAETRAIAALDRVKADFGFTTTKGNFAVKASSKDVTGITHTKLDQVINGIPVLGGQFIVHEKNGAVSGVTGSFQNLKADATTASITQSDAVDTAVAGATVDAAPKASLVYLPVNGVAKLAYAVSYSSTFTDAPGRYDVYVSAVDGSILKSINKLETATGTGTGSLGDTKSINTTLRSGAYYLEDTTKAMTGIVKTSDMKNRASLIYDFTDTDNVWNTTYQAAAVDAHYYAGVVFDWYKNKVGRNSIDNNGMTLHSLVHYNKNYNNAFWNGTYMVYGDGDGVTFRAFSAGLDVIAHELTHGVTEHTSGLIYENQSGALNESWSDAMGAVVEGKNWLMGEDLYISGTGAIRDMADPTRYGDPAHMNNYVNTTSDNGGVHTNSGIPNKAFYNFATAIGNREIAGKIWYQAEFYMTTNTNFSGARAATLSAASALYGTTYTAALQNAWSAVGVY